jgi:hypothetical protein
MRIRSSKLLSNITNQFNGPFRVLEAEFVSCVLHTGNKYPSIQEHTPFILWNHKIISTTLRVVSNMLNILGINVKS